MQVKTQKIYCREYECQHTHGMGNAATPMGIKAMQCLDKENNNPRFILQKICVCLSF